MWNWRGFLAGSAYLWGTASAAAVLPVTPVLLDNCPAILAVGGEHAGKLAQELEGRLRLAMAWPEKGPLVVSEFPSQDGIPTYLVHSTQGLGAVLRVLVPGLPESTLQNEAKALDLGATLELGPQPVDVDTAGVLAMHDLGGEPVEQQKVAPLKELAAALRSLHGFKHGARTLTAKSQLRDLLAAVEREKVALGAQAEPLRKALERVEGLLGGESAPAKVPCLRNLPPGGVRIDRGGNVRFYFWNEAGMADPFEDYAQAAQLLDLKPDDTKDFLGRVLLREAKAPDLARLAIYRALKARVPSPATAGARELLRLATLVVGADWERWSGELIP